MTMKNNKITLQLVIQGITTPIFMNIEYEEKLKRVEKYLYKNKNEKFVLIYNNMVVSGEMKPRDLRMSNNDYLFIMKIKVK